MQWRLSYLYSKSRLEDTGVEKRIGNLAEVPYDVCDTHYAPHMFCLCLQASTTTDKQTVFQTKCQPLDMFSETVARFQTRN